MNFQPKTEEELQAEAVMPGGEYDFEVIEAADTISKRSGNDMITAKLKVFAPDGSFRTVTDYLMEKMAWKLRHFCEATGLMDKYDAGTLAARNCEGRAGRVILQVDPERKSEDGTKTYSPKNSVKDYVASAGGTRRANVPAMSDDMEDSEIPF